MATSQYSLSTEALIPTIPLFTLAGYFMAESQASKRLVRVFQAMVGQYRAGPAMVTLLVCAFFTAFTGGSESPSLLWVHSCFQSCWRLSMEKNLHLV